MEKLSSGARREKLEHNGKGEPVTSATGASREKQRSRREKQKRATINN